VPDPIIALDRGAPAYGTTVSMLGWGDTVEDPTPGMKGSRPN
jgi:hypothetical protein